MTAPIIGRPRLSKSKFVAGIQCLKRLYWQVYEPESQATVDAGLQARLEQGNAVGAEARKAFPGGALVTADHEHPAEALSQTSEWIADPSVPAIFEAALQHDGVLVRVDILERLPRNRWRLVEVKSSTSVNPHYLYDLSVQQYVTANSGLRLSAVCLMHLDRDYTFAGEQYEPDELFQVENLKPETNRLAAEVPKILARQRRALRSGKPPRVAAGSQCTNPFVCEFYDGCNDPLPAGHVSELPHLSVKKKEALARRGIATIQEIPDSFALTPLQRRVWDCVRKDQPWFGPGLSRTLARLKFPLHFMDFETFYPALPRHKGMRPYSHIPFQWSVHSLESPHGELRHREFMAEDASDPRRAFLTALLDAVGNAGTVVVYNKQFESARLADLAAWLPEFRKPIARLQKRLWDLLPVVREHVYHPAFQGSFSIKSVLPALVPCMTYSGMKVSNGEEAGLAWDALVNRESSNAEKQVLRDALRAYCRQDTLAMVKLWEVLRAKGVE